MKKILAAAAVLLLVLIALPLFLPPGGGEQASRPVEGLPWQIEVLPGGKSRVFGLTLGADTLADARTRFGDQGRLAVVTAPGETGSLEMYFEDVTMGAVTGKAVITGDLPAEAVEGMRQRAVRTDYMQSSTKKATLTAEDERAAYAAPIRAIAFIPSVNLDEGMILQRFGPPGERLRTSEHAEHFLYADRGLDLILDSEGKELLQYVAPAQFARLREPLKASAPAQR